MLSRWNWNVGRTQYLSFHRIEGTILLNQDTCFDSGVTVHRIDLFKYAEVIEGSYSLPHGIWYFYLIPLTVDSTSFIASEMIAIPEFTRCCPTSCYSFMKRE